MSSAQTYLIQNATIDKHFSAHGKRIVICLLFALIFSRHYCRINVKIVELTNKLNHEKKHKKNQQKNNPIYLSMLKNIFIFGPPLAMDNL